MRQGRRGLEVDPVRDRQERPFRRGDELGERSLAERKEVGEDAVAGFESRHVGADRLDRPGNV